MTTLATRGRGRPPHPPRPLTADERRTVAAWAALGAKLALAASAGRQPADRDDAVGEAHLQMCRSMKTFDARTTVQTHLGTAARYGAREAFMVEVRAGFGGLKGQPTHAATVARLPTRVGFAGAEREVVEDSAPDPAALPPAVVAAIEALPERYRLAVRWRYLDGLLLEEMGDRWGVSKERARQILRSAMNALRTALAGTIEE